MMALENLRQEDGQMVVEMAVMIPVVIVCIFILVNLGIFINLVARFDRVVPDVVCAKGCVYLSGKSQSQLSEDVKDEIVSAMGELDCIDVEVVATKDTKSDIAPLGFSIAPTLTRYKATLKYYPQPSAFSIGNSHYKPPVYLSHSCEIVVDVFRNGSVI